MDLKDLMIKVNGIEIELGDKKVPLRTNIRAITRLERNYKLHISNERKTFLNIIKDNFTFMYDYYALIESNDELSKEQEYSLLIDMFLTNVDLVSLAVIFYSLLETDMTYEEFTDLDILELLSVNFGDIIKSFYDDNLDFDAPKTTKKKVTKKSK